MAIIRKDSRIQRHTVVQWQ